MPSAGMSHPELLNGRAQSKASRLFRLGITEDLEQPETSIFLPSGIRHYRYRRINARHTLLVSVSVSLHVFA